MIWFSRGVASRKAYRWPMRFRIHAKADPASTLEAAEALFARGDHAGAIGMLTEANRRCRDDRFEQRLVSMRFDAFAAMDWSRARGTVPDVAVDLFPGVRIPEIAGADLSVERVSSAVLRHGCCIVRGLVGRDRVEVLVNDIDQALVAYDSTVGCTSLMAVPPWFVPFSHEVGRVERKFRREVGGVLVVDSPPALFDVIETFEAAGIRRVVGEFFGEQPALLAKKWTLRRVPHDSGESGWHQDGAFMGGDIRSLNVWLSLSHCGDDAPGLDIVARRFDEIVPTGSDGAWLDWNVGPGMVDRVAQGTVTRPIFDAGDAVIFDHMLLHRTAVDPGMTRDRYAIEAWFLAPSTYGSMTGGGEGAQTPPRDQLPMLY
jgi:hypothetical protein